MQASELLTRLKRETRSFDYSWILSKLRTAREYCGKLPSITNKIVLYNYETLDELIHSKKQCFDELDDALVHSMEKELRAYLDANIEGGGHYKEIVRIVSLYLSFIAHKPLHPAGVFAANGKYVAQSGKVVCPLRAIEYYRPGSLCKYCCSVEGEIFCEK